ncbi:prolipoprotein diacylglyceryl transferase [bacterium]|nr:prolipoprotein diacylglyceryl transferase [bacterium]
MKFLLLFLHFDADPVCFTIPFLNHPIAWYGVIFSAAFFFGYKFFIWLHLRYNLNRVEIPNDLEPFTIPEGYILSKKHQKWYNFYCKRISDKTKQDTLYQYLYLEEQEKVSPLVKKSIAFADAGLIYIILGTIIGARLGHILFYENIWEYLLNPILIIKTWEGGLASHGGILAILLGAYLFIRKNGSMSFLNFMDMISAPTMFVCAWIRIGNFINQEILGAPSNVPWAIIFDHPATGGAPLPRHPMPLYEFILYMSVSILLFVMWKNNLYKKFSGLYVGLAMVLSFTGRFFLEFFKNPQTAHDIHSVLQVGQLLSLPMIAAGIYLIFSSLQGLDKKASEH